MITLRLGAYQQSVEQATALVEALKRHKGSCDTVWLTTIGYYPSVDYHRQFAANWKEANAIFRKAGLKIGINIANTVGHRDWPYLLTAEGHPFMEGMEQKEDDYDVFVGADGNKNTTCFCWNSERLRAYFCEVMQIYAETLDIDRYWFDDDLRANQHMPGRYGCFCDRCIEKFNARYGCNFTREQLVQEINYGDRVWRQRYIDFSKQGIYDFVSVVSKAILEVAPDAAFGLEYGHWEHYLGIDENFILDALHDVSGRPVETRPGGGYYNDKAPWTQFSKAFDISHMNAVLPPYVQASVAELENLPGAAYGKSIGGILNEGTLELAFGGCTELSFTDVQSMNEPMAYYEKIFAGFSELRPYWERLSAVSKDHIRGGVCVVTPKNQTAQPLTEKEQPFSWTYMLQEKDINLTRVGVPLTHDTRHPAAYLLHQYAVDTLTDEEIAFLLAQPVIADGEAVVKLCERGYAKHFPFTAHPIPTPLVCEAFTAHPVNGDNAGAFYEENSYANKPMKKYTFDNFGDGVEVLGVMHKNRVLLDGSYIGATTLVAEIDTPQKAKWAIFGYSVWTDIISAAKRNQIMGALACITALPAYVKEAEQVAVANAVDADGKTVAVTVAGACQSGSTALTLRVRNPRGGKITVLGTRRNIKAPAVTVLSETVWEIALPPLAPYETMTVFFDD